MRPSTVTDLGLYSGADATATAMERGPFDDVPTVEDVAIDDLDPPVDPPTAKHFIRWTEEPADRTSPGIVVLWG